MIMVSGVMKNCCGPQPGAPICVPLLRAMGWRRPGWRPRLRSMTLKVEKQELSSQYWICSVRELSHQPSIRLNTLAGGKFAFRLKVGVFPGAVPEMKNLHQVRVFLNVVVNQDRSVDQLPNAWPTGHGAANIGKAFQEIDVVEKSSAKTFGCCWIVGANVFENTFQIG